MRSMTGYGRAQAVMFERSIVFELSSVNKRGFEFLLHAPKEWQFFERKAGQLVRSATERGRLRLAIHLHPISPDALSSAANNPTQVAHALDGLKTLCASCDVPFSPSTDLIHRIACAFNEEPRIPPLDEVEDLLIEKTQVSLDQMMNMREEEGKILAADLRNRSARLLEMVLEAEALAHGLPRLLKERLLQRLKESNLEIDCENEAVLRELALYADRSDVSEEITRIRSHLQQLEGSLSSDDPIGRKLEFIIQELGREFNTLTSKSLRAEISSLAIEAKVELEKIREQAMNLE